MPTAWFGLHKATQNKIDSVKKMIQKKTPYSKILSSKWVGNESAKKDWFAKFDAYQFFTNDELMYLNMESFIKKEEEKPTCVEEDQVSPEEKAAPETQVDTPEIANVETSIPDTLDLSNIDSMLDLVGKMNDTQRLQFVSSPLFINNVIKMLADYKEGKAREVLVVPDECRTEPVIVRSMRVSDKFYQAFSEVCNDNNITITIGLNCALLEFVKKYKK